MTFAETPINEAGFRRQAAVLCRRRAQFAPVIEALEAKGLPYEVVGRRAGDIAASWADPTRAHRELGWRAEKGIDEMCADTWRWQSGNPNGYPDA